MDNSVGDGDISRVVRVLSEGLLSDDDIVDEILSEGTLVDKRLSSDVGKVGTSDRSRRNVSVDDVGSAAVSIERSEVLFVSLDGTVDRGEDGERSSSGDLVGNSGGLEAGDEKVKVVVSLKVRLLESLFDTISSPDLSRSLKGGKDINGASSGGRGGGNRGSSGRGSRSGSSRGGGGRSSGSGGSSTSVTHLQVFLERRGSRDTLAGIFVFKRVRVTGISHTSGSEGRAVEEGGGNTSLHGRGEGGSTSDEGSDKGDFALYVENSESSIAEEFC